MFTGRTIHAIFKQGSATVAPPHVGGSAVWAHKAYSLRVKPIQSFTTYRYYSSKIEEFQKSSEETLRDLKQKLPPTVDYKSALDQEAERLKVNHDKLYAHFADPSRSAVDEFPSGFYDLDSKTQSAYKEFFTKHKALYPNLIEKYNTDLIPGLARIHAIDSALHAPVGEPVHVAVTGAAGAIGYALCFRIASGGLFGPKTPVVLHLLELPQALGALKGVEMELLDCAFPTLKKIVITDKAETAFAGVDYALLVGAQPRTQGMERGDLLLKNAEIFGVQGKALATAAKGKDTRVVVVGNPANTNALIAAHHAKNIPRENFIAMTRLDHNRGLSKLADKARCHVEDISRFIIWGNHSATQFPDLSHALINNQLALDVIKDDVWYKSVFIPGVQQRGAEIIKARGASSAASAASSALDTVHDWHFGTNTQWMSAAVNSSGEYGVTPGLYYSYPVVLNDQKHWDIVKNLPIEVFAAEKMERTHKELLEERDGVTKFLSE